MSADQTPTLAGKYILLRKLAAGGMAEVHLARQVGLEGFEKLVVLKRIKPELSEDPEFVTMFLDEARTAADLRHPNVVDIYEVGSHEGNYFIAMEYIHGQSVRRIQRELITRSIRLPAPLAVHVVIEAARGLDYAHGKVDLHGRPLGIVHRDVSPQNVLVSYQGETKIVDFGIARAASRSRQTAPGGGLFGKLDYMSPEQALGGAVGPQSDQFSLGAVLFELTTNQRLFWHESDAMTIRNVIACDIPKPSSIVPDYPAELQEILLRALAKEPANRWPSCKALADALEDALAKSSLPHGDAKLGTFLRELFPDESKEMPQRAPVSTSVRTAPVSVAAAEARPSGPGSSSFAAADTPTGFGPGTPPTPIAPATSAVPSGNWDARIPTPAPPPAARATPGPGRMTSFLGAPGSWKGFALGVGTTVLVFAGGYLGLQQVRQKEVYAQAGVLMGRGENVTALEVLHSRLKDDPGDMLLREMAVRAAGAELDRLANEDVGDALEWIEAQLETKPYLEPLRSRVPALTTLDLILEMERRGNARFDLDKVWEMVRKYEKDPDAPYLAAMHLRKTRVPRVSLGLFEEAIRRGHAPTVEIWDDCRRALETDTPAGENAVLAMRVCRSHFPAELEEWRTDALASGSPYAWANALALSRDSDPAVRGDRFAEAVVRHFTAHAGEAERAILLAEGDTVRGRRALDALRDRLRTGSLMQAERESLEATIAALEKQRTPAAP